MTTKNFSKEVWERLSAINVNEHTNEKGGLTYLSWAWAWGTLMAEYPESHYEFDNTFIFANDTAEIWVTLTVKDGDNEVSRRMWLPVMDYKNKSIQSPTTRDISDTRMRCLTKAMAMFGLGFYIYAGEDVPSAEKPEPLQPDPTVTKAIEKAKDIDELQVIWKKLTAEQRKAHEGDKNAAKERLS